LSVDLSRKLLALGLVQREEMQHALFLHVTRRIPLAKLLGELPLAGSASIEEELAKSDAPFIRTVAPVTRLIETLPQGLCKALLALPVRQDVLTRTVDVATIDPRDPHIEREFAYHFKAPIRLIRAPLAAIEEALRRLEDAPPAPEPPRPPPPERLARRTPPYLLRSQIDAAASSVPQLRAPSERPIPLVQRAARVSSGNTKRPPGPFSLGAPRGPFPDPGPLYDAIRAASNRDEIIDLLLNGLAMIAGRAGTFAVRKAEYQGWRCNESLAHVEAFREVRIASDVPSIFATAAATGFYLGPLPPNAIHAELLGVMGGIASEVAVCPLRVEGRLALLLFLDDIGDTMLATRRAEELGRVAGEALGRLVRALIRRIPRR
jgi:hypothetical protein